MSGVLSFRGVTCVRGGRALFEAVSFDLGAGEAALVTGMNGAGKSSLIRVAAGLLKPVGGTVVSARCALLTDAVALDDDHTLGRALAVWATLDERPDPQARVAAALADLDLAPLGGIPVRLLSTGQRRRAAFARVLASGAPVWLLDEPANGLDIAAVARLQTLIARHRAAGGVALVATHLPLSLPDAREIAL
ncbi:heme ABC exporter ATP-binding protein CcmA [soil metagenome]